MKNIPMFKVAMSPNIDDELLKVMHSGWIGQGPAVNNFEKKLSEEFANDKVLTLSAGTHGLSLALRLAGVGPGDEVISTPLTCLSYLTPIYTDISDKPITIGKIVNQKLDVKVRSLNEVTGKVEWKKVINWIKLSSDNVEWYNLFLRYGNNSKSISGHKSIWITGDHNILTDSGWKRVDQLKQGFDFDKIATDDIKPNNKQMEFINGTMLGDGHIQKSGRITFAHSEDQKEWIEYKKRALNGFESERTNFKYKFFEYNIKKEIREYRHRYRNAKNFGEYYNKVKNGYAFETATTLSFKELRRKWYRQNSYNQSYNKIVPDIELTPLTLATWYMDDGNLSTTGKGYTVTLCTENFHPSYFWRLFYKLNDIGIKCTAQHHGKNSYRIYIGKGNYYDDGNISPVDKFLKIISSYIIPSMRYKLPIFSDNHLIKWDEFNNELWNLGEPEVQYEDVVAKKGTPPEYHKPKHVYCLEVEDNHNFITKNMVVSNCTATNMSILQAGADIVWADVESDFNIDAMAIKYAITDKTKAIVVVHWGGYPCDMKVIREVAGDIPIIEDCAHAYGSLYKGHPVGDCYYSDYAMFSFQAIKHLTSVDGGALCCNSIDDYKRGKLLRWYGIDRESPRTDFRCESDIEEWGYKFHMNDVCATIGLANIPIAKNNILLNKANARYYEKELSSIDGIELTQMKNDRHSSYWLFTMLVDRRSDFTHMMGRKGIAVSRVHERNDKHTCFAKSLKELPCLESIIDKMICIPVGFWVTPEDIQYIVDSIKGGW